MGHYKEDTYTTARSLAIKVYINPANCVPYKLNNGFISINIVGLNLGVNTLI
jgi:hypothetical protein